MVLLTFALLGISALAWSGAAKDAKASNADRRVRNSGYDLDRDFENVLRACHIQRKSQDGIKYLPEDRWRDCVSYILRQPYTTEKDVEMFRLRYNRIRKQELKKVQDKWDQNYNRAYQEYLSSTEPVTTITFEKTHYLFDEEFVVNLADNLYHNTFFGEMAKQPPKVVFNPNATNISFHEIWVIRCPGGIQKAKKYWKACSRKLGFPID
ncbi:hypothetical protein [uncultured Methanobrevibacter sp.]|uniref:hypothetical protein n=1 Tax=uncultured Methanobrevibacter sp. TaxID=253161 RepID=UPI0025DCB79E|nr:hypothetical protein [uncultured Methanobrevibacter sp.]